jgi:hypothetical protein
MNKSKWAVLALLAASGILASGCGGKPGGKPSPGIHGQVRDSAGKGIANAQVSVVEIPPGGMDELVRMVNEGKSLWGWHFKTDEKGRFCLTGIPTGGLVLTGMTRETPPYYTPAPTTPTRDSGGSFTERMYDAMERAEGRAERNRPRVQTQYTYEQGPWVGLVVQAPGYRPYIAKWRFGSPNHDMQDVITLDEYGQSKLDPDTAGFTVTLAPLGTGVARAPASDGAAHGAQERGRTRVLRVPAGALARYCASVMTEQPSWGPGRRGDAAGEGDVQRGPAGQR